MRPNHSKTNWINKWNQPNHFLWPYHIGEAKQWQLSKSTSKDIDLIQVGIWKDSFRWLLSDLSGRERFKELPKLHPYKLQSKEERPHM